MLYADNMAITGTIVGLDLFIQDFAAEVLTEASTDLLEDLKDKAPYDTGALVDSAYGPVVDEHDLTATIGFSAPQADFTDQGAQPHDIYPVVASRLRFFWPDGPNGAGMYSFSHVDHPGQEGTGWFTDTVDDEWDAHVQDAIERTD